GSMVNRRSVRSRPRRRTLRRSMRRWWRRTRKTGGLGIINFIGFERRERKGDWAMAHRGWRRDGFTPEKRRKAVKALAKYGTVVDAARAVGVSDTTFYRHLNKDPDFLRMCLLAREQAAKPIETLAWERATIGAEEVVIRDGKIVQVKRKPSDAMLRMLLMASNPKKHGRMAAERRKAIEKA